MIANTAEAWSERASLPSSHEAALWSYDGQQGRFAAMLGAVDVQPGDRLLDYGCGTGALADCLDPQVVYCGYDTSPGMLARARLEHPGRTFVDRRPLEFFEVVCCVGPFNLSDQWSKRRTWIVLRRLWRQTRRVLAVSLYAGADTDCLIYTEEELRTFAAATAPLFTVDRHRPNDLLLVLRH